MGGVFLKTKSYVFEDNKSVLIPHSRSLYNSFYDWYCWHYSVLVSYTPNVHHWDCPPHSGHQVWAKPNRPTCKLQHTFCIWQGRVKYFNIFPNRSIQCQCGMVWWPHVGVTLSDRLTAPWQDWAVITALLRRHRWQSLAGCLSVRLSAFLVKL